MFTGDQKKPMSGNIMAPSGTCFFFLFPFFFFFFFLKPKNILVYKAKQKQEEPRRNQKGSVLFFLGSPVKFFKLPQQAPVLFGFRHNQSQLLWRQHQELFKPCYPFFVRWCLKEVFSVICQGNFNRVRPLRFVIRGFDGWCRQRNRPQQKISWLEITQVRLTI